MANRRGGTLMKERGVRERGVRERGGGRARARPRRQDYAEQLARPFQPRDWVAPAKRRSRARRRPRTTGWGNAAVAAAAALAGVLIGVRTARRER